jgi:hypothetical protein
MSLEDPVESTDHNFVTDSPAFLPPATGEPSGPGVSWYRRGRFYVATMTRAANAGTIGNHEETQRLLEYADEQLWPLDQVTAEDLRDFIAGINRETEERVRGALHSAAGTR